jgi:hypothetical protein
MKTRYPQLVRRFNAPKANRGDIIDPDFDDNSDFICGLAQELDHTGAVSSQSLAEMIIHVPTNHAK